MNFRDLTTNPHAVMTPAELAKATTDLEAAICTGWDQDAYVARCAEEAGIEEALAALKLEGQP